VTAPGSTADHYTFDAAEGVAPAAMGRFSVGAYLSEQRRLRGLSLEDLESVTRIPRRSLARLESGAFDRQQDAFARGFVRTVALAIGLDPGDTLVRMLTSEAERSQGRQAVPLRDLAGLGLVTLALLLVTAFAGLALAGKIDLSSVRSLLARPEALPVARRDYVREFAEQVRTSPAGSFAHPRPVEAAPAMYIAPAAAEVALDAVFARPGIDHPTPAAVSSR
jgi:hypothetical protein